MIQQENHQTYCYLYVQLNSWIQFVQSVMKSTHLIHFSHTAITTTDFDKQNWTGNTDLSLDTSFGLPHMTHALYICNTMINKNKSSVSILLRVSVTHQYSWNLFSILFFLVLTSDARFFAISDYCVTKTLSSCEIVKLKSMKYIPQHLSIRILKFLVFVFRQSGSSPLTSMLISWP